MYKGRWGNCRKSTPEQSVIVDYRSFVFAQKIMVDDELNWRVPSFYKPFVFLIKYIEENDRETNTPTGFS